MPTITLLTPANGSVVHGPVRFSFRVDWPGAPTTGTAVYSLRRGTDPGLTQNVVNETHACPMSDVNCWGGYQPNGELEGRFYWQVTMVAPVVAASPVWMFTGMKAPVAVDTVKPYVRTFTGSARRGARAHFKAKVRDNTGEVRMRALLTYRGLPVLEGRTQFARVDWRITQQFFSIRPLSRRLPAGIYKICITAWDRAGNQGRSCARYRVR